KYEYGKMERRARAIFRCNQVRDAQSNCKLHKTLVKRASRVPWDTNLSNPLIELASSKSQSFWVHYSLACKLYGLNLLFPNVASRLNVECVPSRSSTARKF